MTIGADPGSSHRGTPGGPTPASPAAADVDEGVSDDDLTSEQAEERGREIMAEILASNQPSTAIGPIHPSWLEPVPPGYIPQVLIDQIEEDMVAEASTDSDPSPRGMTPRPGDLPFNVDTSRPGERETRRANDRPKRIRRAAAEREAAMARAHERPFLPMGGLFGGRSTWD